MLLRVFRWEFLSGKRFYLALLIYFLLLYSSGCFEAQSWTVETKDPDHFFKAPSTPGDFIDLQWSASNLWWFMFPVVAAYAVFVFSYELDKGILRTYLLSSVQKSTLFSAKLLSILLGLFIPLIANLLIVYPLADPVLFRSNPLEVYVNLPRTLVTYASMLYAMLGIATLSSIAFRKPLYAFAVPIAVIYTLNMGYLHGIYPYLPPRCFEPLTYSGAALFSNVLFLNNLSMTLPAIITSTICFMIAYIIFVRRDMT